MGRRLAALSVLAFLAVLATSAQASAPRLAGKIVFSSDRAQAGNYDVFVVNADGSGLRRLTRGLAPERMPAWSPNRRRIAFVQGEHIVVMSAAGTNRRRLVRGSMPTWSRDGREVAYTFGGGIFVVSARGGRPRYIAKGSKPAWSPRRSEIAFVRGPRRSGNTLCCGRLLTVNPRTRATRTVISFDCLETEADDFVQAVGVPEWAPDGRRLLVPVECSGRMPITYALLVNADGSDQGFLPLSGLALTRLAWSPDGSRVAFARYRGIATATLAGGAETTVTSERSGDWSPDW